jgi:hypothetical protein
VFPSRSKIDGIVVVTESKSPSDNS